MIIKMANFKFSKKMRHHMEDFIARNIREGNFSKHGLAKDIKKLGIKQVIKDFVKGRYKASLK